MRLRIDDEGSRLRGVLEYIQEDQAFQFSVNDPAELTKRLGQLGTFSLVIGTLQLEVAVETGLLLFAHGYCPQAGWVHKPLGSPKFKKASTVRVSPDQLPVAGTSLELASPESVAIEMDDASGWLRLRIVGGMSGTLVLIADGIVIDLHGQGIGGVWLRSRPRS